MLQSFLNAFLCNIIISYDNRKAGYFNQEDYFASQRVGNGIHTVMTASSALMHTEEVGRVAEAEAASLLHL